MTTRTSFDDLPSAVRAAVESRTGPIIKAENVSSGFNSAIAARVHTAGGTRFIKGLPADHKRVWTQQREADVNPALSGIAPQLLWRLHESGWVILCFEHLEGHHADYTPGSQDLPRVAELLTRLGEVACPDSGLKFVEQRLSNYVAEPDDVLYFAGASLVHTDLNNENVIVADGRAYLVDWAWASRGAAWLDAAYWVVWLIAAGGHAPVSAERCASRVPAWATAPEAGVTAFARATANMWQQIAGADPDPWTARNLKAAQAWAEYRQDLTN
ncbi:aminoglycoside phosphotransferase [Streptomyces spectabilis]|uniref:Aminoglycoside phosphotransferase n=1 Tax=Streptomyces spectabilis TaxID=68270 RepID=A0A5P2XAN0_STRST|nr:aminoglycoside phosphotransferase [Streptomyces spectabilis]MBB5103038.1 hypothetical protein [Streptomyces spectabilis]MCI3902233.1 aminoglycoside phosphotransferase [Streptomyces spectabilis]QEV59606.1 aminoglycoside phosphotransferase [Streptomyces spectabilis]GGV15151.1 hypothetical protein GCM10010245_26270 [Streptomyces spectabilis]